MSIQKTLSQSKLSTRLMIGLFLLMGFSAVAILSPKHAFAATDTIISNQAPLANSSDGADPRNTGGALGPLTNPMGGNRQPWFAVGQGAFDGATSYAKLYIPAGETTTLRIENGNGICGIDVGSPSVTYTLAPLNANEDFYSGGATIGAASNPAAGCGDITLRATTGTEGVNSTVTGHTGFRVWVFLATINSSQVDTEKSFRLTSTNTGSLVGVSRTVSYVNGANRFNIYQRDAPSLGGDEWNYSFQMAPKCSEASGNVAANLIFYDADNGVYSPQQLGANLQQDVRTNPGFTWSNTAGQWSGAALGGDHQQVSLPYGAWNNNNRYKLHITGFNWHNTVQMQVPYDQFDAQPSVGSACATTGGGGGTNAATCSLGGGAPSGNVVLGSPAFNFNVLAKNTGTKVWTGTGPSSYQLQRQRIDPGNARAPTQLGVASIPVNPSETSNIGDTIGPVTSGNSYNIGQTYTFSYIMLFNGTPFGSGCSTSFTVTDIPNLSANCTGNNLNLYVGYAATPFQLAAANNGHQDWSDGTYRLRIGDQTRFSPASYVNLHWQVEGQPPNSLPTFPHNSDTFDLAILPGLGVGDYSYNFQMDHAGTVFGNYCVLTVHVSEPQPDYGAVLSVSCTNVTFLIHIPAAQVPTGTGPRLVVYADGVRQPITPPYPMVDAGGGNYLLSYDPFNASYPGGASAQYYPYQEISTYLLWHSTFDNADTQLWTDASHTVPVHYLQPQDSCLTSTCVLDGTGRPEPGVQQNIGRLQVQYNNLTTLTSPNYRTNITWPSTVTIAGYTSPFNDTSGISPGLSYKGIDPALVTTNSSGTVVLSSFANGRQMSSATACAEPIQAFTRPYFKTTNGDISAGGAFQVRQPDGTLVCTDNYIQPIAGNAYLGGIRAFSQANTASGSPSGPAGASTDYAAYALGLIDTNNTTSNRYGGNGFYTQKGVSTSLFNSLFFANVAPAGGGSSFIGGLLGGLPGASTNVNGHCIPDYFNNTQKAATPTYIKPGNTIVSVAGAAGVRMGGAPLGDISWVGATGQYYLEAGSRGTGLNPVIFSGSTGGAAAGNVGTPATPGRYTFYVKGDVYLSNDIIYPTVNLNPANPNSIPYFSLVVQDGNIYIGESADQLDGLYIAQPGSGAQYATTGNLITCSLLNGPVSFSVHTATADEISSSSCTKKLTINGAVVAKRMLLLRSNGSVVKASANEDATGYSVGGLGTGGTGGAFLGSNNVAEVFNYIPEMVLGRPNFRDSNSGAATPGSVTSIFSLPPVL